ncbi:MAG: four helix bundle protein [Candidatus Azotimanducaceae bacterium]|jgi:four helix bundle protein
MSSLTSDQLENRLIDFAVSSISYCKGLEYNYSNNHLGKQLIRSSTSVSLNYGEACSAESRRDFIHKMRICLKELKESYNCYRIIIKSNNSEAKTKDSYLLNECKELMLIFSKSVGTASSINKK